MTILELHPSMRLQVIVPHNHTRLTEIEDLCNAGISGAVDARIAGGLAAWESFTVEFANGGDEAEFSTASGIWNNKLDGARVADLNEMFTALQNEFTTEPTFTALLIDRGSVTWVCDLNQTMPMKIQQANNWVNSIHGTPPMRPWQPDDTEVSRRNRNHPR